MNKDFKIFLALKNAVAFCKQHFFSTIAATIIGTWTVFSAVTTERLNRYEAAMLQEYLAVRKVERDFLKELNKFTYQVASGSAPDPALVQEMNTSLVDMHQRLGIFSDGLDQQQALPIRTLQNELNEVKKELQNVRSKNDLQFLAADMLRMQNAYKSALPVFEARIGKPLVDL